MKPLADGSQVPSRMYYYLLDFNEQDNWYAIQECFKTQKLRDLNIIQFLELFEIASKVDYTRTIDNIPET